MIKYIVGFLLGFGLVFLTDRLDFVLLNIFVGLAIDFIIWIVSTIANDKLSW